MVAEVVNLSLADARAAVRFLSEHEAVDRSRIAVIGHSEGGVTVPILARQSEIAAIVLMAATGRPMTEVIYDQNVQSLESTDMAEEERAKTHGCEQ